MLEIINFQGEFLSVNSYLIYDKESNNAFIIDPCARKLDEFLEKNVNVKVKFILLTHAHFDHIIFLDYYTKKYKIPFYLHFLEETKLYKSSGNLSDVYYKFPFVIKDKPKLIYEDAGTLFLNGFIIKYEIFPGHCKGMLVYNINNTDIFFTGDLVFHKTVGRYDLPDSSFEAQKKSLRKINNISESSILYPGHGKKILKKELIVNKQFQEIIK